MIIVSQAFTATPKEHAPAVVLGLLPGLAAWGWLLVEMGQLGWKISGVLPWATGLPALVEGLGATSLPYVRGLLALKAGFMFSAMFLSAIAVFLIEKRFARAALWSLAASLFSWLGLMHAYSLTPAAVREELRPGFAWEAALGYLGFAAVFGLCALARRARPPGPAAREGRDDGA
jgi:AGZA family xanthine/uracil permease-like MFS transporter